MSEKTNKKLWISNLRVIAMFGIIIAHVSTPIVYGLWEKPEVNWWIGNFFDSASRLCIPIFVMVTGALLLPREIELKPFLQKRFTRVLWPFLFWSTLYAIMQLIESMHAGVSYTVFGIVKFLFIKTLIDPYFHFWYVYMILGLYLFMPILSKWILNATEKEILYFLTIWFVTLFADFIGDKLGFLLETYLVQFTRYVGYLVLGYYLSTKSFEKMKHIKTISLMLFLVGFFITAFGTYFFSKAEEKLEELFYFPITPNMFILATGIFLFVKSIQCSKTNKAVAFIRDFIDKYSYGAYLAHMLVLIALNNIFLSNKVIIIHAAIDIPLMSVLCLMLSSLLVYVINKLPFGKYISG